MNVVFQFFLVGPLALAAQPIDIERIVCQVEAAEFGVLDGVLEVFVLKLRHLATLGTDLMMVRIAVVALLVLRRIAELVLDDQPRVDKQDNSVVEGSPADAELFLIGHERVERVDVEMAVDGVDGIEYGIAFGSLPMPVRIEIFGEYLLDRIFHILNLHPSVHFLFLSANKVKPFLWKAKGKAGKVTTTTKSFNYRTYHLVKQAFAFG